MLYFVVFPPLQGGKGEGEMARVVPIVWRSSFSGRRGRVARGKPWGFALPLCAGRVAGSAVFQRGREACRPATWGLIAQRAAALVSAATLVAAARGGRLEGGREREVGGKLHRARVLRAAVAPLVEGEAGLRGCSDGLRAALLTSSLRTPRNINLTVFLGKNAKNRVFLV